MSKLDRLHRVELRDVWQEEAQDFTPWFAPLGHKTRRHT